MTSGKASCSCKGALSNTGSRKEGGAPWLLSQRSQPNKSKTGAERGETTSCLPQVPQNSRRGADSKHSPLLCPQTTSVTRAGNTERSLRPEVKCNF